MQIKKQTDQAIRILMHLSKGRKTMIGKELAELVGVSEKYLPYIMHQLRCAGLIVSTRGTGGGYALAKSAQEISLLDVMAATADEPQISCYSKGERGNSGFVTSDVLLKNYDLVQGIVMNYFKSLSVEDLSKPARLNAFYSRIDQANKALVSNKQDTRGDGI